MAALTVPQALQLIISLTNTGITLINAAKGAADVLRQARAEGRDVTAEELDHFVAEDDRARALLESAIAAAQATEQPSQE